MHKLYTLGYQLAVPDDVLVLVRAGAVIVDTRLKAWSQRPQWRQSFLESLLGEEYVWVPEFGNVNYNQPGGHIRINDIEAGMRRLEPLLEASPVVLICVCADELTCHRSVVADLAARRFGVEVVHLSPGERLHE